MKIIPNSFQTPNFFVDECMALLTGNEFKCLIFVARKTFGWQKTSDRIAKAQIMAATGLGHETVDNAMAALVIFGLVLRISENNLQNAGTEWALQTDENKVHFDLMLERRQIQEKTNLQKTKKARQKSQEGVGMFNSPTSDPLSVEQKTDRGRAVEHPDRGDVEQPTQKPVKSNQKKMGADAPALSFNPNDSLEERIAAFPDDCRDGARLMLEVFNLRPPVRPAPGEKGGEYALWINGLRTLHQRAEEYSVPLEQAFHLTWGHWNRAPFHLSHPGALLKTMTSALAASSVQNVHEALTPLQAALKQSFGEKKS